MRQPNYIIQDVDVNGSSQNVTRSGLDPRSCYIYIYTSLFLRSYYEDVSHYNLYGPAKAHAETLRGQKISANPGDF